MRTVADSTITQALIDTMTEDNVTPYIRTIFRRETETTEDFEWGSDADALSDNGGDVTWAITVAGTSKAEIDTSQFYTGTRSGRLYRDGTNSPLADLTKEAVNNHDISFMVRTDGNGSFYMSHGDGINRIFVGFDSDENVKYYDTDYRDTGYDVTIGTWHLIELKDVDFTNGTYDIWLDSSEIASDVSMQTTALTTDIIRFAIYSGTAEVWVDDIVLTTYTEYDYSSRLEYLEHHEEPYRERAVMGFQNRDGALDDIDLTGMNIEIGYGYDSSGNGGSATDCVGTATLWVKAVQKISQRGNRIYQVYCEGMWGRMRNEKVLAGVGEWRANTTFSLGEYIVATITADKYAGGYWECTQAGETGSIEPFWWTWASPFTDGTVQWTFVDYVMPMSKTFNMDSGGNKVEIYTIEDIMQRIAERAMGFTWIPVSNSDNLIDVFYPVISIGLFGYESAAAVMYRLIWMTESWIRSKPNMTLEPVFVDENTATDITFYSDTVPQFDEWSEQIQQLDPNHILVLCNADPETGQFGTYNSETEEGYELILGEAVDQTEVDKYYDVIEPFIDANIRTQLDADNRAEAILYRIKVESGGGRLTLPYHDCRLELFDVAKVVDNRI